ncbi:unnamed protein product [Oikopleura dioica]|nr:unnamed protein product [Oikopleura dioica]
MKLCSFLFICSANALNAESKKGKIQFLSDLLVEHTRSENDDALLLERIEKTVTKLVSALDTVNYSACDKEFDFEEKNVEFDYTEPEDKTVICDLAERVPMKIRSWVRQFGCKKAFVKKYMKKMRKQAARLKNLAQEAGRCICFDPCAKLSGSCWTIVDSCEDELNFSDFSHSIHIEPIFKIYFEFKCPAENSTPGKFFRMYSEESGKTLLEVEKTDEDSILVTNESVDFSLACTPGDWHSIELEHQEKTGFRTNDFTLREEWIKIDGVVKRANIQFLSSFSDAVSFVDDVMIFDFLPATGINFRNLFVHTF